MQDIDKLKAVKSALTSTDLSFAESLIGQYETTGKLSEKQWHWVHKLTLRAEGAEDKPEPQWKIKPLNGIALLFQKASTSLKSPAIVLNDANGSSIRISRAKDDSKNPGYLYVKRGPEYLGKVSPMGEVYVDDPQAVAVLVALSEDPVGYAAMHGHTTGKCCFCNSTLTDEKSTSVGYGPVCATHYDLPWGANELEKTLAVQSKYVDDLNKSVSAKKEPLTVGAKDKSGKVLVEPNFTISTEETAFEVEQMQEKAQRPLPEPVPGRACKDLLEYMEQT